MYPAPHPGGVIPAPSPAQRRFYGMLLVDGGCLGPAFDNPALLGSAKVLFAEEEEDMTPGRAPASCPHLAPWKQ